MPRRTKQQAQATREQLLDAAESLFLAHGLVHTSLNDIAQAAGLTRGAIYWHFADKVALAQALLDRVDLPMEPALTEAEQAEQADPIDRLRTLALGPFALMRRDPRARRVFAIMLQRAEFVGELAPLTERQNAALGNCVARMERLFVAAQRRSRLAPGVRPRHAALALLALVDGLLRLATLPVVAQASRPPGAGAAALPTLSPAAASEPSSGPAGAPACMPADSAWPDCAAMRAAEPAIDALLAGLSRPAASPDLVAAPNCTAGKSAASIGRAGPASRRAEARPAAVLTGRAPAR